MLSHQINHIVRNAKYGMHVRSLDNYIDTLLRMNEIKCIMDDVRVTEYKWQKSVLELKKLSD